MVRICVLLDPIDELVVRDAQSDLRGIQPASMPLMTLASTAIDQTRLDMEKMRYDCLKFLPTDSALFFAGDEDRVLLKAQRDQLAPVLARVEETLGVLLKTTQAMSGRIQHSLETVEKFRKIVQSLVGSAIR